MTSPYDLSRCEKCRRPMFYDDCSIDQDEWQWKHWDPAITDHEPAGEYVTTR